MKTEMHIRSKQHMNKFKNIVATLMVIFMVSGALLKAQNQEVTIVAPYKPVISDAFKKSLNPVLADTLIEKPPVSYSISSEPVYTTYGISAIKPSLIDVETEEEMRRNYLRAGFGNYTMPYVELFTNSLSSEDFSIGFHARHLSSQGKIEDYGTSSFSQNDVALSVSRYLKKSVVSGKVYYDRDVVHYYGYKPAEFVNDSLSDDDLRQRFSTIGANFRIQSNKKRGNDVNYLVGLNLYHLSDLYETTEFKVGLQSNLNTKNEFFDFVDKQELGADLNVDFYNNQDSLISESTIMAELRPYLRLNFEFLDLTLGVRGVMASDSASDFYVYPDIRASYQVIPGFLRFYATVSGGLQRNSYRSVSMENPWVNPIFPVGFTSKKYDFKGGVTGKMNSTIDYNFSVSYAEIEDMLLFNNDFFTPFSPTVAQNLGNKFTGIYDDAKVTTVSLELGYQQTRFFNLLFRASYRDYQMATQAKPWHLPSVEASLSGRYFFTEKISFSGDLFFRSNTYAQIVEGSSLKVEEIKAFADLNLGGAYQINDRVSVFLNLNNVLGTRYFRWYNYPSQRINVMGGVTFSF
jgi:outer membrane receptor protein involved in Fe transport